jgi:hypothetical protein
MAINYKVLGQNNPSASGLTTLYTVPGGTQTVCSTLNVCNLLSSSTTYRLAIRPSGAAIDNKHYIVYDNTLDANDSLMLTLGLSLGATDIVSVYAASSGVSFSLFGSEIS